MTTAQGWDDILDQDEHILWQGRPDGTIGFERITDGHHVFRLMRDIKSSYHKGEQA